MAKKCNAATYQPSGGYVDGWELADGGQGVKTNTCADYEGTGRPKELRQGPPTKDTAVSQKVLRWRV